MAGTLVISTLSDGSNSTSATNPIRGSAKAWVNFTGSTAAINASYNVSSVTRVAAGTYTINLTSGLSDTSYATTACIGTGANGNVWVVYESNYTARTASSVSFAVNSSGSAFDPSPMSVAFFR